MSEENTQIDRLDSLEKKVDTLSMKMTQAIDSITNMIKTLANAVTEIDTKLSAIESRMNSFDEFSKKLMPMIIANQDMIAGVAEGVNRVGEELMNSIRKANQLIEASTTSTSVNIAKIKEDLKSILSNIEETRKTIENKLSATVSSLVEFQKKIDEELNAINSKIGGEAVDKLISTSMDLSSQLQNAMHMITINQLISRVDELTRQIFSAQPVVVAPAVAAPTAPSKPAPSSKPAHTSPPAKQPAHVTAEKKEEKEEKEEKKEEGIEQTRLLKPSMLFGRG